MSGIFNRYGGGGGAGPPGPAGPSTDLLIRTYVPGVSVYDAVYQTGTGAVDKASAVSVATTPVLGIVVGVDTPLLGQCTVQKDGDIMGFSGLTAGNIYMLSKTPGQLIWEGDTGNPAYPTARGNVIQAVAIAMSSSTISVAIQDQEEL